MSVPKCENCFHFQHANWRNRDDQVQFARCAKGNVYLLYATSQRLHPARSVNDGFADPDLYNCGTEGTWFEPLLEVANV